MADKQPSFATRRRVLEQASRDLVTISHIIADEAERMAAAEKRFAERDAKRNTKASR